jgi:ubiquinone/menaquinone biosynthesis C-methylase UbiE
MRAVERGGLTEWRRDLVRPAGGRVLEIAAGTGLDFAHYLQGVTVIATEPNLAMLARARVRAKGAPATILLVAAEAEALPFRPESFDTCVIALGLCTIASPAAALAEVQRVVRPGGSVRLLEHVRVESPIVGSLQDALTPAWRRISGGCRLNERSVESVRRARFRIDDIRRRMNGHVVAISASRE